MEAFASLLGEFSLRRFVWLLSVAAIVVAGALAYERASATVKLKRIERIAELADRLRALDSARISSDSVLASVQVHLKQTLLSVAAEPVTVPSLTSFAPESFGMALRRFFSGAAIWFLLAMGMVNKGQRIVEQRELLAAGKSLPRGVNKERGSGAEVERMTNLGGVLALVLGVVSVFLPLYDTWWFLLLVYPLVSLFVGMLISSLVDLGRSERADGENGGKV